MSIREIPRKLGEAVVAWIARSKYSLLFGSAVLASAFAIATAVFLIEDKGEQLTSAVADAGGYVAITGLVLGLPALAYAMVTDSTVERIEGEMGRRRRKELNELISPALHGFEEGLPHHAVQVFLPDLDQKRLFPIYDPEHDGPVNGWGIERRTPQALTGSAWVGRAYLWARGDDLRLPKLRLTANQLREYEGLQAVAAAPIYARDRGLDPLGVLTVYSKSESNVIGTDSFQEEHERAADSLAPIVGSYIAEGGALSQHDLSARRHR